MNNNAYLCYIEYSATGEGLTFALAAVYAASENEAKTKFARKYMCNELFVEEHIQACVAHFSYGIKVYDFSDESKHNEIRQIMKTFFTTSVIESVFDANKQGALDEFYFKSYTNYS